MIRIACCCARGRFVTPLPGFPAVLGWRCALVRAPSGGPSYLLDFGELGTALLSQPMIVAEDSGEIGQKRVVTVPGRLVVTRCGGPARYRAPGLQGGQVRPAEDLGAVIRQAAAEIGGGFRVTR